ncbi:MAG: transglutaminase domain-containing protein [Verrucomicrobiota bacterium]
MKRTLLVLHCVGLLSISNCYAQTDLLEKASQFELRGDFQAASDVLMKALDDKSLSPAKRQLFEFDCARLMRIRMDFPLTKRALFEELKKSVKGLTEEEFNQWQNEGRFDSREIDGRRYFMYASVGNLFYRYPELEARRLPPKNRTAYEMRRWETCVAIKHAALAEKQPYVLPKLFQVTMNITAYANTVPAGQDLRAWLPIPREYPFQNCFKLLSSSPAIKHLEDNRSSIRSAYFERPVVKDRPTEFQLTYSYRIYGVWFDLQPQKAQAFDTNDVLLVKFTCEAPHVVFTQKIKNLAQQIAGNESNPCLKARKFYDWITEQVKYSEAIEYSTIRNISDYCCTRRYGDCGQKALLFITLCRFGGIPARWQSGWSIFPGANSIHDWAEVYLAPYGWVPVDPDLGGFAMQYFNTLKPEQRHQIRDFYFGGIDSYRMIANADHSQNLTPSKLSMRSDDVDFQRGELEWGGHNIYFDQYSYKLNVSELK